MTGSGETALAARLACGLAAPHVERDALHWEPNWSLAPFERFRERVSQALSGNGWTVYGNYSQVRDIIWSRAGTVVWLDHFLLLSQPENAHLAVVRRNSPCATREWLCAQGL